MREKAIDIKEVRKLAGMFTLEEIENCIELHLRKEKHRCPLTGTDDHIINELAKAQYVRDRVDKGVLPLDAIRELAEKIRRFQQGENK